MDIDVDDLANGRALEEWRAPPTLRRQHQSSVRLHTDRETSLLRRLHSVLYLVCVGCVDWLQINLTLCIIYQFMYIDRAKYRL